MERGLRKKLDARRAEAGLKSGSLAGAFTMMFSQTQGKNQETGKNRRYKGQRPTENGHLVTHSSWVSQVVSCGSAVDVKLLREMTTSANE